MAAIVGPVQQAAPEDGARWTLREALVVLVTVLAVIGVTVALVLRTTSTFSALG